MARKRKPKAVKVHLIGRTEKVKGEPYRLLDELVEAHHEHLAEAKIALAWHAGWKADPDGKLRLGQAKKASDLDHQLHGHDFVVLLNRTVWEMGDWKVPEMRAILDHELSHCGVKTDPETGEALEDEKGRPLWRIRKHDIEEFGDVVGRHGLWKKELERFVRRAAARANSPLLEGDA